MLQLRRLNERALESLTNDAPPAPWSTLSELSSEAERCIHELRRRRAALARTPWERLCSQLDARVRTTQRESLDDPAHAERAKLRQVRLLHWQNLALRSYQRYQRALAPSIAEAAERRAGAPVRVLEIASGSGHLASFIADHRASGPAVRVTGSDVQSAYVDAANARARRRGSSAQFRVLDAFALDESVVGAVDVVFFAQSAHHFAPASIARIIAQTQRAGASHLVIIDGHRSARALVGLTLFASLSLDRHFTQDALISTRRFYAEAELALLARIAAPRARVEARTMFPLTTVLTVAFDTEPTR